MDIKQATKAYEAWLRKRIPLLETDLRLKHQRMAASPFAFLRATFYRWVQLWPQVCPELATAPALKAVGDLHVENFGTWRDSEGRLIWGVNDFDEVARMPYAIDLVRLAASARLAISENHLSSNPDEACDAILTGYWEALDKGGSPFVLAEQHRWLRELAVSELRDPASFWEKLGKLPTLATRAPSEVNSALRRALPEPGLRFRVVHRRAGLGSLGRRRFTALAEWRGGCIAREAKELVASAWVWEKESQQQIMYQNVLDDAVRVPDPFVRVSGQWLVRRLAPDCSRVELGSVPKGKEELKILNAMGSETANIHLATKVAIPRVSQDLKKRAPVWLSSASKAMTKALLEDWKAWSKKQE